MNITKQAEQLSKLRSACAAMCRERAAELMDGAKAYPPKEDLFADRRESSANELRAVADLIEFIDLYQFTDSGRR